MIEEELSVDIPADEIQEELPLDQEDDFLQEIPEEDKKFAKGFDPSGEKTLEQFISDGKFIDKIQRLESRNKQMENDFNERMQGLARLQEAQLKQLRAQKQQEFDDAVNMSDLEGVKRIQQEMNELEEKPKAQSNIDDSLVQEWNEDNPWIFERTPKAAYARQTFDQALGEQVREHQKRGGTQADFIPDFKRAIKYVDSEVAKEFSEDEAVKPTKTTISRTQPGRTSTHSPKISWNQLTPEEVSLWKGMGGEKAFGSKEKFLKAVADNRSLQQ